MVPLEYLQLFISSVFFMELFGVVRKDKVVLLSTDKHGGNEARLYILDGIQFINIKSGLILD